MIAARMHQVTSVVGMFLNAQSVAHLMTDDVRDVVAGFRNVARSNSLLYDLRVNLNRPVPKPPMIDKLPGKSPFDPENPRLLIGCAETYHDVRVVEVQLHNDVSDYALGREEPDDHAIPDTLVVYRSSVAGR